MTKKTRGVPNLVCDELASETLEACRDYLQDAEDGFLARNVSASQLTTNGKPDRAKIEAVLPDASKIARLRFQHSLIHPGRCDGEDRFNSGMPFVAAVVNDRGATSERYFAPAYFNAMLLFEASRGRFGYNRSKDNRKADPKSTSPEKGFFYVAFYAPETREGNHYLRRIIADPPAFKDVRQRRFTDGREDHHYDYRPDTFVPIPKSIIRQEMKQLARSVARSRDDAVTFAVDLFKQQVDAQGIPSILGKVVLGLTEETYRALLERSLRVADDIHKKLMGILASEQENVTRPTLQ